MTSVSPAAWIHLALSFDPLRAHLPFADEPLVPGSAIRAVHVNELRTRIDRARSRLGLSSFTWGRVIVTGLVIEARDLNELRIALAEAYQATPFTPPSYTDPTLIEHVTAVKAAHIAEIRVAVRVIE